MKINPLKGNKTSKAATEKNARDKVLRLNNKFVEYKQQLDSLED